MPPLVAKSSSIRLIQSSMRFCNSALASLAMLVALVPRFSVVGARLGLDTPSSGRRVGRRKFRGRAGLMELVTCGRSDCAFEKETGQVTVQVRQFGHCDNDSWQKAARVFTIC